MAGLACLVAIFQLNFGGTETNAKKNLSLSMKARASVVSEFETLTCPLRIRHSVLGTDLRMFMVAVDMLISENTSCPRDNWTTNLQLIIIDVYGYNPTKSRSSPLTTFCMVTRFDTYFCRNSEIQTNCFKQLIHTKLRVIIAEQSDVRLHNMEFQP